MKEIKSIDDAITYFHEHTKIEVKHKHYKDGQGVYVLKSKGMKSLVVSEKGCINYAIYEQTFWGKQ